MRKLVPFVMLATLAVACGSSTELSPPAIASHPAGSTSGEGVDGTGATGTADPLVGEWIQTFVCEDEYLAVDPPAVDGYDQWVRDQFEAPNTDDPCAGSKEELTRIVRFEDGHVVIFDPPNLEAGLNASYEVHGDTFTANDGGQNIPGTFTFRFEIVGDEMTVELVGRGAKDPWVVSAWEAAPFIRSD